MYFAISTFHAATSILEPCNDIIFLAVETMCLPEQEKTEHDTAGR
jgi:hypothetical protein